MRTKAKNVVTRKWQKKKLKSTKGKKGKKMVAGKIAKTYIDLREKKQKRSSRGKKGKKHL